MGLGCSEPDEQAPHVLHMVNWAVILVEEVSIMAADEVVAMDEVMHVAPLFVSGVANQVTMHLNVMQLQKKYKSTGHSYQNLQEWNPPNNC